ncbi:MAG: CYTH domain-containing protein [Solirubrobacterales bacterium]|nr:CYTH domain-containing protein [Solirubrobacterales bacterium]
MEIERKFLVEQLPADLGTHPSDRIEQGYIAITEDGVEIRIRRYGDEAFLTIKSGGGEERLEEEIEIDDRRFQSLWPLTEGRRITKRRYRIPYEHGALIELDVYDGALEGLITAEVEFDSSAAASAFASPRWLGSDVTDEPSYKNKALAVDGLPRSFQRAS